MAAYDKFNKDEPTGLLNGVETMRVLRANQVAIRDAVMMGYFPNWNMNLVYNTPNIPERIDCCELTNGSEDIHLWYEYSGDNLTGQRCYYRATKASSFIQLGRIDFTYVGDSLKSSKWTWV